MENVKVKGKDLLDLLENKVTEIKTDDGKFISKKNIDLEILRNMPISQIIKVSKSALKDAKVKSKFS